MKTEQTSIENITPVKEDENRFNFSQPFYFLQIDTDPERLLDLLNNTILSEILFSEPLNQENVKELKDMRLFVYKNAIYECDDPEVEELLDNPFYGVSNPIPTFKLSKGLEEMNRYLDLASESDLFLKKLPFEMRTYEKCLESIRKNIYNIADVPNQYKTRELCSETLNNFPKYSEDGLFHIIGHIPYPDMITTFTQQHKGNDIAYVPKEISPSQRLLMEVQKIMESDGKRLTRQEEKDLSSLADFTINLRDLPEHRRTKAVCYGAVMLNDQNLLHVPDAHMTKDLCNIAVDVYSHSLTHVPDKIKTDEYMMEKIKIDGWAIRYAPIGRLTKDMCKEALKTVREPELVRYIPFSDVCLELLTKIEGSTSLIDFVQTIKPNVIDDKIATELVRKEPGMIKYIPEHLKTGKICMSALKNDASLLKNIPDRYKSKDLCLYAIRKDSSAILGLPPELKNDKFYMFLVKDNGINLQYIPEGDRTSNMCMAALGNTYQIDHGNLGVVGSIPHPDIMYNLVKHCDQPDILRQILMFADSRILNHDIAYEATKKDGVCVMYLPDFLKTQDVCENAVFNYPGCLNWIPERFRSAEMCLYATKCDDSLKHVVPHGIDSGENVYSFSNKLESNWRHAKTLDFDQIRKLYQGETISVKGSQIGNAIKDQFISYNKDSRKITIKPIHEKEKVREQNTKTEKRKGLKI